MKRFKSISRTKKIVVVGLAAALTLGIAGTAFAYFTATATNTNAYVTVGSPGWSINVSSYSTAPLYPGGAGADVYFSVTNTTGGQEYLSSVTVAPTTNGAGAVYDLNGTGFVNSCAASWFTGSYVSGPAAGEYGAGAILYYHYQVTMSDSGNQDSCQGLAPQLTITVS
jgi:hypothetical protein